MSDEDNFDVERFIEEIKKRLAIWDPNSKDYREIIARKSQWDEVCAVCIPNFEGLSASEKLRLGKELQMKWKHLRDSYCRYLRTKRARRLLGRKPGKKYLYAYHLNFLKGVIARSGSSRNPEENDSTDKECEDGNVPNKTSIDNQNDTIEAVAQQKRKHSHITLLKKSRTLGQKIGKYVDKVPKKSSNTQEVGSDDMDFFRSLLPLMIQMPLDLKMQFRINVMKAALDFHEKSRKHIMMVPTISFQQLSQQSLNPNQQSPSDPSIMLHQFQANFHKNHPIPGDCSNGQSRSIRKRSRPCKNLKIDVSSSHNQSIRNCNLPDKSQSSLESDSCEEILELKGSSAFPYSNFKS